MQSSNKMMLFRRGALCDARIPGHAVHGLLPMAHINRLAEISAALPVAHALGGGSPVAALGAATGMWSALVRPNNPATACSARWSGWRNASTNSSTPATAAA